MSQTIDIFSQQERTRYNEMDEKFMEHMEEHPEVIVLFSRFTRQIIARGFQHYSVNSIFEMIRWHTDKPDVDGKTTFKLSNNHRPFYARFWMDENPQYNGFFRCRPQASHNQPPLNRPEQGPEAFPYEIT